MPTQKLRDFLCKITNCLELLAYCFSLSQLGIAYSFRFNISSCNIASVLLITFFTFDYHAFDLKHMLLLASSGI